MQDKKNSIKFNSKVKNVLSNCCAKLCKIFRGKILKIIVTICLPIISFIISLLIFINTKTYNDKVFLNSIKPYLVIKDITNVGLDNIPSKRINYTNLCDESYYKKATNSNIRKKYYKLTLSNIGNGNLKNLALYDFNTARKANNYKIKTVGSSLHEDNILSLTNYFDENSVNRNNSSFYIEKSADIDIYINCLYSCETDSNLDFASIIMYQDLYNNIYTDFLTIKTANTRASNEGFEFSFFKDDLSREKGINILKTSLDSKIIIDYVIDSYKKEYTN